MQNWKSYFEGKILSRGLDYYEYGDVRIHDSSPQHVEAQVEGSRTYNIELILKIHTLLQCL
ncbi:SWIM zinc finger domain-containing protein [Methanobrevibacter sp.]|uniref:SWIM zinc finger family protein n=1 Tax=Methanobrevibacter sp. TaxID=66852 RepID=UPI00388E5C88